MSVKKEQGKLDPEIRGDELEELEQALYEDELERVARTEKLPGLRVEKKLRKEASLVVAGISRYGGNFMRLIAGAMQRADAVNLAKIRQTWREEWDHFLELALDIKEEKDD